MPISCTARDRALTARVTGELDHHSAKGMMLELSRQIDLNLPHTLTLDLGALSFTDSSGIALLLRTQRRMAAMQGSLTVCNTPPQAMRVFQAAGLDRLIKFQPAEQAEGREETT